MTFDARRLPLGKNAPSGSDGKTLFVAVLLLALVAALGLRDVLSLDALAPAVASLLFALAATVGGISLLSRKRARALDIAGILTLIGVIVSLTIESDQMTRLIALSDQPESN